MNDVAIVTNFDLFGADLFNTGHFFKGNVQTNLSEEGQFAANIQLTGTKQALIKKIDGTLFGNRKSQEIAFNFKADNSSITGSFQHHNWNFTPLTIGLVGELKQFPNCVSLSLVDNKICKNCAAIFGPVVSGNAHLQVNHGNGIVALTLGGAHGSFELDGAIKDDILYLNDNLKANVVVTPDLEKSLLKELVPFLIPIVKAEQPVQIEIDAKKFQLPLKSFILDEMKIGSGKIIFPSIIVGKKSQLGQVAQVIGIHKDFEVQFTPLYFRLSKSQLDLLRMDMLLDKSYPIAAWGGINFAKSTLKFNIGISAAALEKSFGITGLSSKYMLQVPVKGVLGKPSLDTKVAVARISALVAQRGGTHGKILGTVIEAATGAFTDDKVPGPTTIPPWSLEVKKIKIKIKND